jgi:GH24 family phage-related lysozyme (muramidase)
MEIKPAQARVLLEEDVRLVERTITRLVTVPLYGRQFDALVSYVMDTGAFPFAESRMLRLLNRGWYDQVAVNILKHNMAKGLLNPYHARRLDEARLWNMECETRIAA